jgi:hypothetical protein
MSARRLIACLSATLCGVALLVAPPASAAAPAPAGSASGASSPARQPWQLALSQTSRTSAVPLHTVSASLATTVPTVVLQAQTYPWSYYGDPVLLTAIADLSRLAGGGTMFFYDGRTSLGALTVDGGGMAQMTTSRLIPGKHSLTALYKTNPKSGTSSPAVAVTVYKRPLTVYPAADMYTRPVGAPNPTYRVALADDQGNGGLVNGDTLLSAVTGAPKFTTAATKQSPPSVYAVALSGLSSTNYQIVYKKSAVTVYSKDLHAGMVAPSFTGKDQFGNDVKLSDLRGKVVLLDLSAIWCGPSEFMGSQMRSVISDLQQRGVPFSYLAVQLEGPTPGHGGTQTNALNYAKKFNAPPWTHVLHPQGLEPTVGQPLPPLWDAFYSYGSQLTAFGTLNANFGLGAFPTLAVIDPAGVITETQVGALDKDDLIPNHLDPAAPDTGVQVTSAPQLLTGTTSVSFTSTNDVATTCRVDNGSFTPCTSPFAPVLPDGIHEIQISAGRTYPASVPFELDTSPPDTTITSGPGSDVFPIYEFAASESATFQCWVDSEAAEPCDSPWYLVNLEGGAHTFHVAATDTAGNTDPTPATSPFTTQPLPDMTAQVQPASPTTSDDVQIVATVTDAISGDPVTGTVSFYECCTVMDGSTEVAIDGSGNATLELGTLPPLTTDVTALYLGDSSHGARYVIVHLVVS